MKEAITRYLKEHGLEAFCPKAVLFDMDGVLYDSMPLHAKAWHETMATYGIDMTDMDAYRYEGMRGIETIQRVTKAQWGKAVSEEQAMEMYKVKTKNFSALGKAGMIPGVYALQETLHDMGMKIGIVTGSGQPSLLKRILHDFDGLVSPDIMVCARDVKQGKPKPDPYIKGMEKATAVLQKDGIALPDHHLQPWQTMVVENAPLGVEAGHKAGCFTVAVNTGPLPDRILWDAGADIVLKTMDELREKVTSLR